MHIDPLIIKVPYNTWPHMERYDGEVFNKYPNNIIIEKKKLELQKFGNRLYGNGNCISMVSEFLLGKVCTDIVELGLHFEEDIAILHKGYLDSICFCFPSSWTPSSRLGMSLGDIHKPVADGAKLIDASQKISDIISKTRSFRRYVYTLSNSIELNQLPDNKSNIVPSSIEQIFFRMETQTTLAMNDGNTAVFFVKVDVCPLKDIWDNLEIRQRLISSVNSMSQAVLEYKNLVEIKKVISGYGV